MIPFRFSILLLCVILPPVLYIATVQVLETHIRSRLYTELEATYLGDTRLLLDGAQSIQRAVPRNIERTLARNRWIVWGGKAGITVRTGEKILLYPSNYEDLQTESGLGQQSFEIASENFRLINQGLELTVDFKLPHNILLTNLIFGFYILLALSGLFIYYRRWSTHYRLENTRRTKEIERLSKLENQYRSQLDALRSERAQMADAIAHMKTQLASEKEKASTSEEEMIQEIIALEETITRKEAILEKQSEELNALQVQLVHLETPRQKESPRKNKSADMTRKRLATLYKSLEIHERAIEGYLSLTEELKIKAEEVMGQLNDQPASIQIKRKVFGKKNRVTVLEVVFGYKGRLYFRSKGDHPTELLAIGTKNSQQQDLAYLERL